MLSVTNVAIFLLLAAYAIEAMESSDKHVRFLATAAPTAKPTHHYSWGDWGHWSSCAPCPQNNTTAPHHQRTRHCLDNGQLVTSSLHCGRSASSRQSQSCHCPEWSAWSTWSDCSVTCAGGNTIRVRHCGQNDNTCPGHAYENKACNTQHCPVINGQWSDWETWSSCSDTCGLGIQTRNRLCNNPAPLNGGHSCVGAASMNKVCMLVECTRDGAWSDWTLWSSCEVTCGNGHQTRTRTCDNPSPAHGGKPCPGSATDTKTCSPDPCPVDGGWSSYMFRPCSATCGTGVSVKYRTCTSPAPQHGGRDCQGSATEFFKCTKPECLVDGGWSMWNPWSDCKVVCGDGHQWRTRTCTSPAPQGGGANCTGQSLESMECNNGACPPDIKTCRDTEIEALKGTKHMGGPLDPGPAICTQQDSLQAEHLIQKHCKVTSTELDWELGVEVQESCDWIPLYAPLGVIDVQTTYRKYGIMLNCYQDNLLVADLSCSNKLEVINFKLNHTDSKYHMMVL